MTSPPDTPFHKNTRTVSTMNQGPNLHHKVGEEIAKFEKTMDEIHLIRAVSRDLKSYRKMIRIKQND